jgi:hypothetical protein
MIISVCLCSSVANQVVHFVKQHQQSCNATERTQKEVEPARGNW